MSFLQRLRIADGTPVADAPSLKPMPKTRAPRGYGYRRLAQFKTVDGRRFQLHATRGWKCIGRAS
jgi:hypothetical protein